MAPWQYADPPPPAEGDGRYSATQSSGRSAGLGPASSAAAAPSSSTTASTFWRQLRSGERQAVSWPDAPASGWWHRPDCNCALCVARISADADAAGDRGALMIVHDRIAAGRPSSGAASVRTYPHGRICRQDACATVLSAYNSSAFCALHERALPRLRRAWRPAVERTCEACGIAFETANERRHYCSDRCRMAAFARRKRAAAARGSEAR